MCYNCFDNYYGLDETDILPMLLELADDNRAMKASYLVKNTDIGRLERGKLSIKKSTHVIKSVDGKDKELEKIEYKFKADPSVEGKPHWGYVVYDEVGEDAWVYELWCDCQDFAYRLHYPFVKKGIARFDLEKKYKQREITRGFGAHNRLPAKDSQSKPKANPTNKAFLCKHLIHALWYLLLGKTKSEVKKPHPGAEVITSKPVKKEVIPPKGKEAPPPPAPEPEEEKPSEIKPIPKTVGKKETTAQAEKKAAEEDKEQERIDKEKEAKLPPKAKVARATSKPSREEGKAERETKAVDKAREEALKKAKEATPVVPPPAPKPVVKAAPAPVKPAPKPVVAPVPKPVPAPVKIEPKKTPVARGKAVPATPELTTNKLETFKKKQEKEKADAEAKKKSEAEAKQAKSFSATVKPEVKVPPKPIAPVPKPVVEPVKIEPKTPPIVRGKAIPATPELSKQKLSDFVKKEKEQKELDKNKTK